MPTPPLFPPLALVRWLAASTTKRSSMSKHLRRRSFVTAKALLGVFLIYGTLLAPASAQPQLVGSWSNVISTPIVPIHMSVLPVGPQGRLLFWNANYDQGGLARIFVRDLNTGISNEVQIPSAGVGALPNNIFCTGHSFLPNGKLLVTGGHIYVPAPPYLGLNYTNIFDPFSGNFGAWLNTATLPRMTGGRWYPTNVSLANGEVLVVSGQNSTTGAPNDLPQVWTPDASGNNGSWRNLTDAMQSMPLYPWMHVAPDGRVFNSGPDIYSQYLNTSGSGQWTAGPTRHHQHLRDYGSSVMYRPGKVLVMGGGTKNTTELISTPTNTAETIDLTVPLASRIWTEIVPMNFPRKYHNATILPDGTVLVTGGTMGNCYNETYEIYATRTPELWNPTTGTWQPLLAATEARLYHSTAVLLPDATVLVAGGGEGGSCGGVDFPDHANAEIFSPPYLFNLGGLPRPEITSLSVSTVGHGQPLTVQLSTATNPLDISRVTLVRLSSVTHAYDENQRFNELTILARGTSSVQVQMPPNDPPNSYMCPPGHYMLFAINSAGVPSKAKFIRVT